MPVRRQKLSSQPVAVAPPTGPRVPFVPDASIPVLKVGQRFRIEGKNYEYIVVSVDAAGGPNAFCEKEMRGPKKATGFVLHCIGRVPFEGFWRAGEVRLLENSINEMG
jgi:hypothetical protein